MSREPRWSTEIRRAARTADLELPADVVEELAAHLEDVYHGAIEEGHSEPAAREAALAALTAARLADLRRRTRLSPERHSRLLPRIAARPGLLEGLAFDLQYALRLLRRTPVFSTSLVVILASSIGATSAVFSVVDAVLLQPLPYAAGDRLAVLTKLDQKGRNGALSAADWLDYGSRVRAFEGVTAYANWPYNMTGDGEPLRLRSIITSGNFFAVLGGAAAIGRVYTDADDREGAPAVVVLTDGFWERRFGRDPAVVGRSIALNGTPAVIVGVMPASFEYPSRNVDLWMPFGLAPAVLADRASEWLSAVARLREGAPLDGARQEAAALAASMAASYPATNADERVALTPLLEHVVGHVRQAILVIAGAVLFVFLVTCLNAANLLLARASVRQDEMAVRSAIGASNWRLVRQVLAESVVLAASAALLGIALGWGMLQGFAFLAGDRVPRLAGAGVHGLAIVFAAVACGALIACCGVAATMALRQAGPNLLARGGVRLSRAQGLRPVLLAAQIAFAFVLVSTAVLLAASYLRLQQVPAGFDPSDVLSLRVNLPRQKYPDNAAHIRFADMVTSQIASLPGVAAAGVIHDLPLAGNQMSFAIRVDGREAPAGSPPRVTVRVASPGYFEVLRVPLVEGRGIAADDVAGREPVAVVNQSAADRYFSGRAIGQRVDVGDTKRWARIVGVVADGRHAGFEQDEGPVVYLPYAQKPFGFINWMGIVVRGPSPASLVRSVKARIAAIDPAQPVYDVMLVDDYIARARAPYRLNSWLVGGLAALSLLLAVAGVFALTTYSAASRRQEFGIRLALGASRADVLRLVLAQVVTLVVSGAAVGAAGALAAGRFLTALLFEMTATDPWIFLGVSVIFVVAATLAALPPAWRSAHLDPATTIRAE